MTKIKPGKWRLKDGREVVVLWDSVDYGINLWVPEHKTVIIREQGEFEGAEYLGPAVIGDGMPDKAASQYKELLDDFNTVENERHAVVSECLRLEQQCKDLEAETVATREQLEKSEERCEELARQNIDLGADVTSERMRAAELQGRLASSRLRVTEFDTRLASDQCVIEGLEERVRFLEAENDRFKRGDFTEDEFQNLCNGMTEDDARRFKAGCFAYWPKLFGKQGVAYEFKDGVEIYRYKSVTVMVRGEREGMCYFSDDRWFALCEHMEAATLMREDSEAWCRAQLEPKCPGKPAPQWREAGEGDRGKRCRVREDENESWVNYDRLVGVIDHACRFVVADDDGSEPLAYPFCEVQD